MNYLVISCHEKLHDLTNLYLTATYTACSVGISLYKLHDFTSEAFGWHVQHHESNLCYIHNTVFISRVSGKRMLLFYE